MRRNLFAKAVALRHARARMHQMTYISTATQTFGEDELDRLLQGCRLYNRQVGVTGLLLYNGRNFVQLIEGDADALTDVMGRVRADTRHDGIIVLREGPVETRDFPTWAMQLVNVSEDAETRRAQLDATLPTTIEPATREAMIAFGGMN